MNSTNSDTGGLDSTGVLLLHLEVEGEGVVLHEDEEDQAKGVEQEPQQAPEQSPARAWQG